MHHLIRRIHLFTGLLLLVFVLMYFITGYAMIHSKWFGDAAPNVSVRTEHLNFPVDPTDPNLAARLQIAFGLRGQSSSPERRGDGTIRLNFNRPGTTFQTVVSADGTQLKITRKDFGLTGLANGLHRLRGYHGGFLYFLWSLIYDLASIALILFAVTGTVLWYQSTARRLAGWTCLGASFGFTAAMIIYLMWTR